MDVVATPPLGTDALLAARERIHIGPVPSWVISTPFDPAFNNPGFNGPAFNDPAFNDRDSNDRDSNDRGSNDRGSNDRGSNDRGFNGKQPDKSTFLLVSKQIHAEHHQTCIRVVQRLENM